MKAFVKSFCVILAEIFDDVPLGEHKDNRYKIN